MLSKRSTQKAVFEHFEKTPNFGCMVRTLVLKKWKKTPHPINPQCLTRNYSYVGAHMMHYNKNDSQIKILRIPNVLA